MCGSTEHKNERDVEKLFSFSTLDRGSTVSAEHKNQPKSELRDTLGVVKIILCTFEFVCSLYTFDFVRR